MLFIAILIIIPIFLMICCGKSCDDEPIVVGVLSFLALCVFLLIINIIVVYNGSSDTKIEKELQTLVLANDGWIINNKKYFLSSPSFIPSLNGESKIIEYNTKFSMFWLTPFSSDHVYKTEIILPSEKFSIYNNINNVEFEKTP